MQDYKQNIDYFQNYRDRITKYLKILILTSGYSLFGTNTFSDNVQTGPTASGNGLFSFVV